MIVVRVDDSLITAVQALGPERLSSVVNTVLVYEVEGRSGAAAPGRMLADRDAGVRPVGETDRVAPAPPSTTSTPH